MDKIKNFDELQFVDDFMFGAVMKKAELCKELLEIILNMKISNIEYLEQQKTIDLCLEAKGVRLDVYAEDENQTVYNIEMQTNINDNLPKRTRYYQGIIDMDLLGKGIEYKNLKKSFIIFLCTEDPFTENSYMYTFENRCIEKLDLPLGDETVKIFLNANGTTGKVSQEVRNLTRYMHTHNPTDEFTCALEAEIHKVRANEEYRRDYMLYSLKLHEQLEKGREEGRKEGQLEILTVYHWLESTGREEEAIAILQIQNEDLRKKLFSEYKETNHD
ncbi:MAG: Rpn family recombination-promoting nuclease/putative transposase [Lachnospiraceae bacterium]|nr:Rpn family recombination-promoting nuclease/putative transposase [Lachnospiraceae bacterium]